MKKTIHRAETRGHANHGWLNTYHTFSFANYYDPERVHFGALRVLNDDWIAADNGFGKHPHQNMEIVSIPLRGALSHADSHEHSGTIRKGEVQIMSAGTGIFHSEKNDDYVESTELLQIWVLPDTMNVEPRYAQKQFDFKSKANDFLSLVVPKGKDDTMWVHQDAWFSWADFKAGNSKNYTLHTEGNGVYIFVIDGEIKVEDEVLSQRDGMGVEEVSEIHIEAMEDSEFLLIEVPMK